MLFLHFGLVSDFRSHVFRYWRVNVYMSICVCVCMHTNLSAIILDTDDDFISREQLFFFFVAVRSSSSASSVLLRRSSDLLLVPACLLACLLRSSPSASSPSSSNPGAAKCYSLLSGGKPEIRVRCRLHHKFTNQPNKQTMIIINKINPASNNVSHFISSYLSVYSYSSAFAYAPI